ncbi:MAG: hypothetical protein ACD_42C00230G0001, partial [uncultured bacterium]
IAILPLENPPSRNEGFAFRETSFLDSYASLYSSEFSAVVI